ncbi:MAG: F0F1 ATP synthase subunit A [Candidatus Paceibacterota bacterium]
MTKPKNIENSIEKIEESTHVNTESTTVVGEEKIITETTLFAEPIHHFKNFTITNALFTSWIAVLIIIIISIIVRKKIREVPGKVQGTFEMIIEGGLSLCDQVTNSRALSIRIFPIAISAFFFILINNWLGLMPLGGFGLVERVHDSLVFIPFIRGGTADINTTLGLSIMAVIGANMFGVFSIGLWKTFNKYVNLKILGQIGKKIIKEPTIILVAPVTFFVGLIEIIGEFAKIASLSFRLFGNIFAGEVLLASIAALVGYIIPIPFLFLEILVGFIQALIFSILLTVYFTIAASDHDEHEEHSETHKDETKVVPA